MVEKIHKDTDDIPIDVESVGIFQALEYLKEQITDQGVNCTLEIGEIVHEINRSKIAVNLFLIAQEVIEDVVVHGKASNVNIALTERYGQLYLHIQDDGKGLNSSNIKDRKGKARQGDPIYEG